MTEKMKLLIAYDGSECAEAALADLERAGLPREAEVVVLTVADVWSWPEETDAPVPRGADIIGVKKARAEAMAAVEDARQMALRASERLRAGFPGWTVSAEACADSPAWGIIKRADEWQPDLIVVGSHGRTAIERFVLGSVSQKVLYEARCSVRIARARQRSDGGPPRLIIGTDGSPDAEAAIDAVARRAWPPGTEARVVVALDAVLPVKLDAERRTVLKWFEADDEDDRQQAREIIEASAEKLRAAGLVAATSVKKGSPKRVLLDEAEQWQADSIFLGARGARGIERFLLGSVSAAVAAHARCSVEVVRRKLG